MSFESQSTHTTLAIVTSPAQGPLQRHTHTYDLMRQCIHSSFASDISNLCSTWRRNKLPRGRIYQMQAVADGRMEISPEFVNHMYCCLGCHMLANRVSLGCAIR